jgi:NAD(P) transhydrogenase
MATGDMYDLVVIGSGPAGEKGACQAAYYGHRVAVVERRTDPGGAAIAVSGVPVKALRDTAVYLTGGSRRAVFGVGITLTPELVMDRLRARVTEVVETMTGAVRENLRRHGVDLIHGQAMLQPDRTVAITNDDGSRRVLHASKILLAVGSQPHHPPELPFDDPDVHDSQTILSIDRLPQRMVVVGGGPVGAEYASIFAELGVKVTLVSHGDRLLPQLDHEISEAFLHTLQRAGATVKLGQDARSVRRTADGLLIDIDGELIETDIVLHALGRTGNVDGLALAEAGVEADARGRVRVDDRFQTTAPGIYAAGDITGPPGLASVAMEQARVAMCRAFDIPYREALDPVIPTGIYTLPEAAAVGLTEEDARLAEGDDVGTGRFLFENNPRARIAGSSEGMVKLVFRQHDRRLLGAHILGEEATELIHIAQAVLHRGGAIDEFVDMTFNFPTRADAFKYAAYDGLPPRARTLRD